MTTITRSFTRAPADDTPADDTPADDTPAHETPAEETAAEETAADAGNVATVITATRSEAVATATDALLLPIPPRLSQSNYPLSASHTGSTSRRHPLSPGQQRQATEPRAAGPRAVSAGSFLVRPAQPLRLGPARL